MRPLLEKMGGAVVCMVLLLPAASAEVTAKKPLARGTILTSEMVEATDRSSLLGVIGKQLTRPIFSGRTITPEDVTAPNIVQRQETVTVEFVRGGLLLSLPGRAIRGGGMGQTISVLIEHRRSPVSAKIVGAGRVRLAQ